MNQAIVTWYGHACFRVELCGSSLVLDPYACSSVPGLNLPDLNADAVHVSHSHSDSGAFESVLCSGRELNFSTREVEGDHDHHHGTHRGKNRILVIEGDGLRIVHLGDQGCLLTPAQVEEIGRPDLLMIPVGGHVTMDAQEAHQVMAALHPHVTVPMHYREEGINFQSIATLDAFLKGVDLPVVRVTEPSFVITPAMPDQILVPQRVQLT